MGTIYINGSYVADNPLCIHVNDRGFQFSDSVYEVILVASGKPVDLEGHLSRLNRSMKELRFPDLAPLEFPRILQHLIRSDGINDGMVYIQVTRGVAARNLNPTAVLKPSVVAYAQLVEIPDCLQSNRALAILTLPDQRWGRCDIKTTSVVANVLARMAALEARCDDAWLVDRDGYVTEACAANAWIVVKGVLVTRPQGNDILTGITRQRVLSLASEDGLAVEQRRFTVHESQKADEAFITSATALITPVHAIDRKPIGTSAPGPITARLYDKYHGFCRKAPR